MQVTRSEIIQRISQLEREVSSAEDRRAEAERNIRQLEALSAGCDDYQAEFERARTARKARLQDFCRIPGQARLEGERGAVLEELLDGLEYVRARGDVDAARSEISREIERQEQVVNECNGQIAGANGSISQWRQQLAGAGKEDGSAGYGING